MSSKYTVKATSPDISGVEEMIDNAVMVDPGAIVETNRGTAYRLPENPEDILE